MQIVNRNQLPVQVFVILSGVMLLVVAVWLWQKRAPDLSVSHQDNVQREVSDVEALASGGTVTEGAVVAGYTQSEISQSAEGFQSMTPKKYEGEAFAGSLAGTDIDGQLRSDMAGNLIVSIEVKDFFDYFLNTVGEVTPEQALVEIERLARGHLPPAAAAQALELLDQYLEYKQAALQLMQQPLLPADQQTPEYHLSVLTQSLDQLKQIRRQVMNQEVVDAFFGMEEAYADYTLEKLAIQQNPDLTVEQKQQWLTEKRQQLPRELRVVDENLENSAVRAREATELLQTSTNEKVLRKELKSLSFSDHQIQDMVEHWQAQRQFETRYSEYMKQRELVMSSGLATKDQEKQVVMLREQFFPTEEELIQARLRDMSL
ncbi:lipase secretion chaperone [Hahella ganghwensis]|uniref:lipase secretion chaperone n=1 Tax=Hahella ganghwensis TaxID=286420 RepID=UPI00068611A6|nr:lipase secretion chaperone [Hahella ganghwensis]